LDLIATAKRVFGDRIERNDFILLETALREISTRVGANNITPVRIYLGQMTLGNSLFRDIHNQRLLWETMMMRMYVGYRANGLGKN
jgi:hypothetical protein